MNQKELKTAELDVTQLITGEDLKLFHNTLNKLKADQFRKEVMKKCEWTYPAWTNRLSNRVTIKELESEAIILIMATY